MGDPTQARNWSEQLIWVLWPMGSINGWIHRNEELYSKTEGEKLDRMMKEVNSQIRRMYYQ